MSVRDLGNEAIAGLFARPGRTVLTCLGTVVGLAALVATLGLSRPAGDQIVGRFRGVAAAGNLSTVNVGDQLVTTSPIHDPQGRTEFKLTVLAASPGLFDAARTTLRTGRTFDEGHSLRGDRVALLGPNAAQRLGITTVDNLPAIRIGDQLYLVVGILDSAARQADLLGAVIIPEGTAQREYRLASPELVEIETDIGATSLIANQVRDALRPDDPNSLRV